MLNSQDFRSLIASDPVVAAKKINSLLNEAIPFTRIDDFPQERGLYFLYLKDQTKLLYIGSAYADKRHLKKRCQQYLQHGSGGNSFTGKLAQLQNMTRADSIDFVRNNVEARFIIVTNGLPAAIIKQRELLSIWALRPPLNFIQPTSKLAALKW